MYDTDAILPGSSHRRSDTGELRSAKAHAPLRAQVRCRTWARHVLEGGIENNRTRIQVIGDWHARQGNRIVFECIIARRVIEHGIDTTCVHVEIDRKNNQSVRSLAFGKLAFASRRLLQGVTARVSYGPPGIPPPSYCWHRSWEDAEAELGTTVLLGPQSSNRP